MRDLTAQQLDQHFLHIDALVATNRNGRLDFKSSLLITPEHKLTAYGDVINLENCFSKPLLSGFELDVASILVIVSSAYYETLIQRIWLEYPLKDKYDEPAAFSDSCMEYSISG